MYDDEMAELEDLEPEELLEAMDRLEAENASLKAHLEELRKFTGAIPVRLFLDYLQEKIDYHKNRMLSDGDSNQWWLETGAFKAVQDIFMDVVTGRWMKV